MQTPRRAVSEVSNGFLFFFANEPVEEHILNDLPLSRFKLRRLPLLTVQNCEVY